MVVREYLSENLLDINFVKLISPIYSIQTILGSSCVVMSGNLVSTITIYQKVYSVLWILVVSGSFYFFELTYYNYYYNKEKTLFYTFAFGLLVQYLSYLFNTLHARFFKSHQTVAVFLKIQTIDRDLQKYNLTSLRCSRYTNRLWIGYILTSFGVGYALYVYSNIEECLYTVPMGCAIFTVYLELVFTGSCIYYLALRLQYLNTIVEKKLKNSKYLKKDIQNIEDLNRVLTVSVGDGDKNIKLKEFTNILTSILKLFHETSKLFTFEILNVVVTLFIWTFLVIESTVVGLRSKLLTIFTSAILVLWILFYFVQVLIVAYSCEWFAKQVRHTKRLALHALSVYCEGLLCMKFYYGHLSFRCTRNVILRSLLRNVTSIFLDKDAEVRKSSWELLQLIEFQKPIFSVYGIFTLNMRLPLQLISVITTNVLVLIQYTSNALNTN